MGARLRSWWQKTRKPLVVIGLIAALVVVALILLEVILYGTGFAGKTLWDWLNLLSVLAIPVVVSFGVVWVTIRQGKVADTENKDNQRESALQGYIDKMSELLLHEKLRYSAEESEVRKIARVRTLTILPRLDADRKRSVLKFLYESSLIHKGKSIVELYGANFGDVHIFSDDLREADLSGANLNGANMFHSNLSETNLIDAKLWGASLRGVNLWRANLRRAELGQREFNGKIVIRGVDLYKADLREADLREANLSGTDLMGANLSDADLCGANLEKAFLFKTNLMRANLSEVKLIATFLSKANLSGVNLSDADLSDADLSGADLSGATVTQEQLAKSNSLKGATMPDGSIHP